MSNSEYNNNQKKIKELEAEILNTTSVKTKDFGNLITSVKNWFFTLPTGGKVIVGVLSLMIAFSLLRTVLSIVQLAFSLAILASIFYIVFQFIVKPK